jgi:murein DD-endopeptidase MepM/ murein hydrolase activator NlpD
VLALAVLVSGGGSAVAVAAAMPPYLRPVKGAIIRHYEPPPTPYAAGHRGIDMAVPLGTPVLASNDGIVAFAGPVGGELYVSIDHSDGIRTTYSYLSAVWVKKGKKITRGAPVGASGHGHPGSTEPPHLHFGARVGADYIDPEPLLLDGLRRDVSQAIRLWPVDAAAAAGPSSRLAGRASIASGAAPAALAFAASTGRRRRRRSRGDPPSPAPNRS